MLFLLYMIDILITSLCLKLNDVPEASKYYASCVNATTAASIQTNVKPTLDNYEQVIQNKVKKETGEAIWWVAGTAYAYEQKGTVNFNIGLKPIVDSVQISGSPNGSGNLNLTWWW